jgi:hypothetical protein
LNDDGETERGIGLDDLWTTMKRKQWALSLIIVFVRRRRERNGHWA